MATDKKEAFDRRKHAGYNREKMRRVCRGKEKTMLGNFTYCNPTKLYFGKGAVENLRTELPGYG